MFTLCSSKETIISIITVLLAILLVSCTMKGYEINLVTNMPDDKFLTIANALLNKGFTQISNVGDWRAEGATVGRFKKDIVIPSNTLFYKSQKAEIYIDIVFYTTGEAEKTKTPVKIQIYDFYKGNNPDIKSELKEYANSVIAIIRGIVPSAEIHRNERVVGHPFI